MTIIFSSQPFYSQYVRRSTPDDPVSTRIHNNGKLWPFFRGCLGAIDGTHMPLSPPTALQSLYRNQKGFLSQNCLCICNFDMLFTYILTGWEGSATDARVWADALAKGFSVPEGLDSIILRMQDILIARNFLFLFVVLGIIFRSGVLRVFGMCLV